MYNLVFINYNYSRFIGGNYDYRNKYLFRHANVVTINGKSYRLKDHFKQDED
ncbi:hypothetical protein [Clostridium butyricum]